MESIKKSVAIVVIITAMFSVVSCNESKPENKPQVTTAVSQAKATTTAVTTVSTASPPVSSVTATTMITGESENYTNAAYEYDGLDRLTKVIYDKDNYIEYTYDANGNITNIRKVENGKEQK